MRCDNATCAFECPLAFATDNHDDKLCVGVDLTELCKLAMSEDLSFAIFCNSGVNFLPTLVKKPFVVCKMFKRRRLSAKSAANSGVSNLDFIFAL